MPGTMSEEKNKAVVHRTLQALMDADFHKLLAQLTEDIEFYVIGSTPFSGHRTGKQALLDEILIPMADQRDADGYSEEIIRMVAEGNTVFTESRGRKTTRAGQQYNNEYVYIFEFQDGLISEWRCYLDTMLLAQTHPAGQVSS